MDAQAAAVTAVTASSATAPSTPSAPTPSRNNKRRQRQKTKRREALKSLPDGASPAKKDTAVTTAAAKPSKKQKQPAPPQGEKEAKKKKIETADSEKEKGIKKRKRDPAQPKEDEKKPKKKTKTEGKKAGVTNEDSTIKKETANKKTKKSKNEGEIKEKEAPNTPPKKTIAKEKKSEDGSKKNHDKDETNGKTEDDSEEGTTKTPEQRKKEQEERETKKKVAEKQKVKRRTVMVTNFPYKVTEQQIKEFFVTRAGKVESVTLKVYKKTGLSKGTAKVQFKNVEAAKKALTLDRVELEGRKLFVDKLGKKKKAVKAERDTTNKNQAHTIHVAGFGDEVTKEDLEKFFEENSNAGPIKAIRQTTKFLDGEHHNIAFIQFQSWELVEEAVKLHGTKLKDQILKIKYAIEK